MKRAATNTGGDPGAGPSNRAQTFKRPRKRSAKHDERDCYVYRLLLDNKKYYGSSYKPYIRFRQHSRKPPSRMVRVLGTRAFLDTVQLEIVGCYPTRALAEDEEARLISLHRTYLLENGYNYLPSAPGRSRLWWALHRRGRLPGRQRDTLGALLAQALHSGSDSCTSQSHGARIDAQAAEANAIGTLCTYSADELVLGRHSSRGREAITPADLHAALARMEAAVPCDLGAHAATAPLPSVSASSVQLLRDTADCAQSVAHVDLTHSTSAGSM